MGACTDESYTGPLSGGSEPGAPVPVKLAWSIQPMQSPLSSGTKAGSGHAVSSTQVCKGMEISLEEIPVTRASIEDEIKNFMVFQFNGTTLESTLVRKDYYSNSSVENVQLNTSAAKNRIIVIAYTIPGFPQLTAYCLARYTPLLPDIALYRLDSAPMYSPVRL